MKCCIHHLKGPKAFRIEMAVEVFPFKWENINLLILALTLVSAISDCSQRGSIHQ